MDRNESLKSLELFEGYPRPLLQFASVCCVVFVVVGVPGNLVTIFALARYRKIRNATAIFIINLSVSDLLNCMFNLPLAASTFWMRSWPHGELVCKMFPFLRYSLAAISVFTVLAITINRYIMISHPTIYPRLYKTRNIMLMIAGIWIVSCISLLGTWLEKWGRFGMDATTNMCDIIPSKDGSSPMTTFFLTAFIIPTLAIIVCYGRIFFIARKAAKNCKEPNRRSVINESSLEVSAAGDSCSSDNEIKQCVPPKNPVVQSLRAPGKPMSGSVQNDNSHKNSMAFIAHHIHASVEKTKSRISDLKPSSKDKRLLSMITAIMVSFVVCHLPITIIKVSAVIVNPSPTALICSYILRFLISCINPLIYVVMSQEYRKAYKKVFTKMSCCKFRT